MVLTLEREPRQKRLWGQIVARAWNDDAFRHRLLDEPAAVLSEEGIDVPPGIDVRVEEGEAGDPTCLRLPPRPASDDLLDEDLYPPPGTPVARGGRCACCCCTCYFG